MMSDSPLSDSEKPAPPPRRDVQADVRMKGFRHRIRVAEALDWLDRHVNRLTVERVPLDEAAGRVLAETVVSQVAVPSFPRAMMDGYALRAADIAGATTYQPQPLRVVGQAFPGRACSVRVETGQAVQIMTGAPLPEGADAVLQAEKVQREDDRVLAIADVPPGKHVGLRGEDIACGDTVLHEGRRLRPQDLGVLSSVGFSRVPVVRRPRVHIVVTGNELLPAGTPAHGCHIADANGPMLSALAARDGAIVTRDGIVPDDPEAIGRALQQDTDVVLVSGGSSVGQEDHAPVLVARLGSLAIHGIAMRPSSPTGMGTIGQRLVFLLPGNPVSCLCAYDVFAGRAIRQLGGLSPDWPYPCVRLPLARKLVSVVGRWDYARVRLAGGQVDPIAISGASILSSATRADGFVVIPDDSEGFPAGHDVDVFLYGP